MTPDELIAQRTTDWERLSTLAHRAQRGRLGALSENELIELGQLYRAATSDLALVRRDFPRHNVTRYLNQLVGQAHPFIYRGEPLIARRLGDFFAREFPQTYRELAPFILTATFLFFGFAILAYQIALSIPTRRITFYRPARFRKFKAASNGGKS